VANKIQDADFVDEDVAKILFAI